MWQGVIGAGLNWLSKGKNLGGLLGAGLMGAGMKKQGAAAQTQSMEDLQTPFAQSQGLINRMTNFGQFSAPFADASTQSGNKAVEDSMMMGMGGSQANAIKNRLKNQNQGAMYGQYQQGLGQAARLQGGIDSTVSQQMQGQRDWRNKVQMTQGQQMLNAGQSIMPTQDMYGEGGLLSGVAGKLGKWGEQLRNTKPIYGGG
tara:strand:+ start:629 stop:1228 length:600 start_codon:yes stop_codon:yes gene_type:complete